jgi:hypothetical protein
MRYIRHDPRDSETTLNYRNPGILPDEDIAWHTAQLSNMARDEVVGLKSTIDACKERLKYDDAHEASQTSEYMQRIRETRSDYQRMFRRLKDIAGLVMHQEFDCAFCKSTREEEDWLLIKK